MACTTSTRDRHDDYWKLSSWFHISKKEMRATLETRNYAIALSADGESLRHALHRSDLAMMSYHGLHNNDLRELIQKRKIRTGADWTRGNLMNHRELVKILERADFNPTFEKFMDLPAELRNLIYEMYYDEFKDICAVTPTQPPLTVTCSVIRRESLAMFYSKCTFGLQFIDTKIWPYSATIEPSKLRLSIMTELFLHNSASKHISMIKKLHLKYGRREIYGSGGFRSVEDLWPPLLVRIGEASSESSEHFRDLCVLNATDPWEPRFRKHLSSTVEDVVAAICSRNGENKLKKSDVFVLRRTVERALNNRP